MCGADGVSHRATLTAAAEQGNPIAIAALEGPECPESLRYLLDWARELHGRSGVGMNGLAPLSWGTLGEWSRFTGNVPDEEDLGALFVIDGAMLHPVEPKKEAT